MAKMKAWRNQQSSKTSVNNGGVSESGSSVGESAQSESGSLSRKK